MASSVKSSGTIDGLIVYEKHWRLSSAAAALAPRRSVASRSCELFLDPPRGRAVFTPTNEPRAIKLTNISKKERADPTFNVPIALRIGELLTQLKHDNIVVTFDIFLKEPTLVWVLELADEGSLLEHVSRHPQYTELEASKLMTQLLSALAYLHHPVSAVAHRNLHPRNLLMCRGDGGSKILKVSGFDKANVRGEVLNPNWTTPSPYLGPEAFASSRDRWDLSVDMGLDLYAAGCIGFLLLCGEAPTHADATVDVNGKLIPGEILMPEAQWSNISPEPMVLVRKLMQADPKKRGTASQALGTAWLTGAAQPKQLPDAQRAIATHADVTQVLGQLGDLDGSISLDVDTPDHGGEAAGGNQQNETRQTAREKPRVAKSTKLEEQLQILASAEAALKMTKESKGEDHGAEMSRVLLPRLQQACRGDVEEIQVNGPWSQDF